MFILSITANTVVVYSIGGESLTNQATTDDPTVLKSNQGYTRMLRAAKLVLFWCYPISTMIKKTPPLRGQFLRMQFQNNTEHSEEICGAREMAQWLKVLAALTEDLGSVPSTDTVGHNSL